MKTTLDQIAEISIGASISRYSKKYDGEKQKIDVLYCKVDEFYTREGDIATSFFLICLIIPSENFCI